MTARGADAPGLILDHLTASEGMPQGTVMATLQDSQGFVWLGTEDGLVRYDGHDLVRYAYSRNAPRGLPGNFIYQIVEDRHHDLWLGIKDAGIARWNRQTDDFTIYRHDPANAGSLASDSTRAILFDGQGQLWIGTSGAGIDVLDPVTGTVEHRHHDPADAASLTDDQVITLSLDRLNVIWVGTASGLDQWQPDHPGFAHFKHDADNPQSLSGDEVSQIVQDKNGSLWVGTLDGGLDRMERNGRVSRAFRHDVRNSTSLVNDEVRALLTDHAGHLWVGTADGLDLFNPTFETFTHYRHEEGDPGSLRDSYVMSLYEDPVGLVWIGTRSGGVSRWNPRSWELGGHRPAWLVGKLVTSFADAADNKVWIGSLGGGLVRFDDNTGEAIDIDTLLGRHNAVGDSRVMALQADRHGTLWIGTMGQGLKKLSPNGALASIPIKAGDSNSVSAAGIMTLFESSTGDIWIGTHGGGANVLSPTTGIIRQLSVDRSGLGGTSASSVAAIAEDAQGFMWLGTDGGGLELTDPEGRVIQVFRHDPHDPTSIPSNTIYAVGVDRTGTVWIGTDQGGMARVVGTPASPDEIQFHTVSREDGLSSDTVYSILSDASGQLWLSGNAGLMRYDVNAHSVKTFHHEHGLQGEEFDLNAAHRLRDGRLCFGGPGGFNIFNPALLTENTRPPAVVLTRLEVLGAPVASAIPYWLLDRIALNHQASIVSLDFGALDFTSPKLNRIAYRVSGLADRWIELGTQHRVTLTNLDAGDHLLEVRAANADSVWSNPPLRITLHRDPAPWKSPWAYMLYALVLLLLIAYRFRLNRIKIDRIVTAKQRLELEVALRTRELLESNQQLAEASEAKSNFLARMSHELRTPMNGVVGSSELLATTPQSSTQSRLTETIRSSARVLLQIVNDLLDLSKIQAGKIEFEQIRFDLVQVMEESATLFAAAAADKGVELVICPPSHGVADPLGDPLRLRQILMNLIGNAVKFTLKGQVVVKADWGAVERERSMLKLTIADTGIGMDAATIAKIFEPFTQADESTTRRFGGSGLGLAICRELSERMGGKVEVDSQPNVGSTFHVSIPVLVSAPDVSTQNAESPAMPILKILTHRSALREAIIRHATALGATVSPEGVHPSLESEQAAILIADFTTHARFVEKCLQRDRTSGWPLIVIAASADVEKLTKLDLRDRAIIVHKPVHRAELRAGLLAAIGHRSAFSCQPSDDRLQKVLRGRILLVEDEPVNAAVAQGYLEALGCSSVWVDNGEEAIGRCNKERFDLIMMDLNMPVMDGFATTKRIREGEKDGCRVPIIALTAHHAQTYQSACLEAGMDDVLSKPYTLDECFRLLGRFINRPALAETAEGTVSTALAAGDDWHELLITDAGVIAGLRSLQGSGNHTSLYPKLVKLFCTSSGASVAQLKAAVNGKDSDSAGAACHKLSAAAANVGALAFSRLAKDIEGACSSGDLGGVEHLVVRLTCAHGLLVQQLMECERRATA